MKQRLLITGLMIILIMSLFSCKEGNEKKNYYEFTGFIQGTSFKVIFEDSEDLAPQIDSLLLAFNGSLDNYDSTSLISRVNRNENPQLDSLFLDMFVIAKDVWQKSDARFDISIAPLVNAWGFGYKTGEFPDSTQVDSLLQIVGFEKLSIENNQLIKADPRMEVIGNAIAQGLSVDYIAENLELYGVENYLVEIGGEIKTKGLNHHGKVWRVGVDKPIQDSTVSKREILSVIELEGKSLATSGNYRKYHVVEGEAVGHAVSPLNGYPYNTDILSVTVIHENCAYADAWATALMLMQSDEAISLVESLDELEAMIVTAKLADGPDYNIMLSSGFPEIHEYENE